jgi:hypothetical protein
MSLLMHNRHANIATPTDCCHYLWCHKWDTFIISKFYFFATKIYAFTYKKALDPKAQGIAFTYTKRQQQPHYTGWPK